jgi:hypothetical protein
VLSTVLDDNPARLMEQIGRHRSRVGSSAMTEKIDTFVYADADHKASVRRYARSLTYSVSVT